MLVSEIEPVLRTGDIALYTGSAFGQEVIKFLEHSPFAHVGMVVRLEPGGQPLLWESNSCGVAPDPTADGAHVPGAQLGSFELIVDHLPPQWVLRQIRMADADATAFQAAVLAYIPTVHGRPFPGEVELVLHELEGRYLNHPDSGTNLFCSELLAGTFMHAGFLPQDRVANSYMPKDFAASTQNLALSPGVTFGDEILLTPG